MAVPSMATFDLDMKPPFGDRPDLAYLQATIRQPGWSHIGHTDYRQYARTTFSETARLKGRLPARRESHIRLLLEEGFGLAHHRLDHGDERQTLH